MLLWPAVDIRDGHAVRLARGDFSQETVYDADPLEAALRWVRDGARALHVVDLDGAREGAPVNLAHVSRIVAVADVPVEVGGGLRTADAVASVLAAGATRAVIGTAALRDPGFAERMVADHGPGRIVVSVDARGGRVAAAGWTEQTDALAVEALTALSAVGVRNVVYSSIERDGMLAGPDLEEIRTVAEAVDGELVYSGGIRSAADLADLAALGEPSLAGVIVGTALFEGRLTVAEGQAALDAAGRTGA
jgi:phosphoribosylformimino-5-aminoimidazole carboxamide ribotide isomerase